MSSELLQHRKLVEIGVGLGDLSERLLQISSLTTYEIDADLCSFVLRRFSSRIFPHTFSLVQKDVLSIPLNALNASAGAESKNMDSKSLESKVESKHSDSGAPNKAERESQSMQEVYAWLADEPYILVSNLPYYIATRIVINLLKDPLCEGFVVMTQKEVALKFCADEGQSEFCALSVLAQSVGETRLLFEVPKEAFEPMPKVTSAVFSHKKYASKAPCDCAMQSMRVSQASINSAQDFTQKGEINATSQMEQKSQKSKAGKNSETSEKGEVERQSGAELISKAKLARQGKKASEVSEASKTSKTRETNAWQISNSFENMLKAAFSAPRKKLLNNLASRYDKATLESIFARLDIAPNTRPHELSTQKYHQIHNQIKERK